MRQGLTKPGTKTAVAATLNHNRSAIDPSVQDARALRLCKTLRDADKCDFSHVLAENDPTDTVGVSKTALKAVEDYLAKRVEG